MGYTWTKKLFAVYQKFTFNWVSYIFICLICQLYSWVCMHAQSYLTLCEPVDCSPAGSSAHEHYLDKNTGVGHHFLLQGIILAQGLNLRLLWLLHWKEILYHCTSWEAHFWEYFLIKILHTTFPPESLLRQPSLRQEGWSRVTARWVRHKFFFPSQLWNVFLVWCYPELTGNGFLNSFLFSLALFSSCLITCRQTGTRDAGDAQIMKQIKIQHCHYYQNSHCVFPCTIFSLSRWSLIPPYTFSLFSKVNVIRRLWKPSRQSLWRHRSFQRHEL